MDFDFEMYSDSAEATVGIDYRRIAGSDSTWVCLEVTDGDVSPVHVHILRSSWEKMVADFSTRTEVELP